mmetsp:Transcript_124846/g.353367  ORF Transcript_124846/g.353367 Transcript_124846/m.353367 type:complete len:134 (-) Transcript_124846:381-782(-)
MCSRLRASTDWPDLAIMLAVCPVKVLPWGPVWSTCGVLPGRRLPLVWVGERSPMSTLSGILLSALWVSPEKQLKFAGILHGCVTGGAAATSPSDRCTGAVEAEGLFAWEALKRLASADRSDRVLLRSLATDSS